MHLVQFGEGLKWEFQVFSEQLTNQISDFYCMFDGEPPHEKGYCRVNGSCENYYSKLKDFTITLDEIIYTIPTKNMVYENNEFCYINVLYNELISGKRVYIG